MRLTEERRRKGALIIANTGWWGAVTLLGVHIGLGGARPVGGAPPWMGLVIVVLIGVGIAGGTALSRMKLARTISKALEVGMQIQIRDGNRKEQS